MGSGMDRSIALSLENMGSLSCFVLNDQVVDTPKRQTPKQHFNRSECCLTCRHL